MSDNNVPGVRFRGFSGEWEKKGLKELAAFSKGYGFSKSDLVNEGFPIILYGRLYTKYETMILEVDTFIADNSNAIISNGGEVIVPASGETAEDISRASVVGRKGLVLGGDLNIIYPNKDLISTFLALSISNGTQQREMMKRAQGKSVVHLHNSDLSEITLTYPTQNEQTKIGEFFKNLDDLIAQNQKKYDKLVHMKKACLDKMFPKDGANTPEVRFQGFSGEWGEYKVCELFEVTRGNVLAATETSDKQTENMPYPVYSSQTKNDGLMGYYSKYLFEKAITWTTDGANAGTVNYRQGKFYSTNVNGVLLSNEGYANKATAESINKVAWKFVSHVGNPKLMNNVMSEINILIPSSLEEQMQLSSILNCLDNLITLRKTELEKLKNIKKACLDKMFI